MAQHRCSLLLRLIQFALNGQGQKEVLLLIRIDFLKGQVRNLHYPVAAIVARERLPRRDGADHFKVVAADGDLLADGVFILKKALNNVGSYHSNIASVKVVDVREEVTVSQLVVHYTEVVSRSSQEVVVQNLHGLVLERRRVPPPDEVLHGHSLNARAFILDGHGVIKSQRLAQPLLAGEPSDMDAGIELEDEKRARPETLGRFGYLAVQSGEDGGHGNHRCSADQHTQDGQEGTELVATQSVQRQQQVFADVLAISLHRIGSLSH